jgi:hypothetical protein
MKQQPKTFWKEKINQCVFSYLVKYVYFLRTPTFLERLKCESKNENNGKEGIRLHSLPCNTLGVKGRARGSG